MRTKRTHCLIALALALATVLTTVACIGQDPTSIRLLQPNKDVSVWIDGWNQKGDEGDRALVEQKPSGMWVVPLNAEYRSTKTGEFTVEIRLLPDRGFVIMNMNGVKTGKDHDDCLAEDEVYAFPAKDNVGESMTSNMEADKGPSDTSNDDCVLMPQK